MGKCKALQTRNFLLAKHNDENAFESNLNTMQEKGEAGPKLISLRNIKGNDYIRCRTQILDLSTGFLATSGQALSYQMFFSPSHTTLLLRIIPDFIESRQTATTGYNT